MFDDQQIEFLPERTTMFIVGSYNQSGNVATAAAANAYNVNVWGSQYNTAAAAALSGSNFLVMLH